jgi:2,4-dienoyl-CoA reductase-like NADH-dependent reductase (Old Yellow Enzyme family)
MSVYCPFQSVFLYLKLTFFNPTFQFIEGGFSEEESRETCQKLEEAGMHLIELSGGTYESMAFSHKKDSTKSVSFALCKSPISDI